MKNLKCIAMVLAGLAFGVAGSPALHAQDGVTRVELSRADLSGAGGTEVIMATLALQPGAVVPRHFHYGDEVLYVLEGGSFQAPGQDPVTLDTGAVLRFPREAPHAGFKIVGDRPIKVLTVHVVDKGKPLVELVK